MQQAVIPMKAIKTTVPLERLLEQLPENYTLADRELIQRAYRVAEEAHREQKRNSGEPYINHCLAVASILADLRVPPEVVAAGLLHDTVEDTTITLSDIKRDFGSTIATLVDGVTKLTNLPRVSRGDQHAENSNGNNGTEPLDSSPSDATLGRKRDLVSETLRKTFLAMGDDVRVVLIKLADRLHNMRTLGFMPESKRKRIAKETLDIFAPLANRLGIWQIKWELEDLGFRYLNPEKYKEIAEQIQERRPDREAQIETIKADLTKLLESHNIKAEISGRPKHIYSIYKKMTQKGKPFDLVRDVRAVRLIVPDVPSCYAALGVIHTHWRPIPGEFDDYIAAPKDNFYQSLHTAGSTPIDFAYHVHTDIGHRCRGARVNGKLVPLYQDLKTGDQVEILTAKRGGPSRDWLNPNLGLVKTQRARSKIKAWFKKQEDEQNLAQGRATLERELQRLGISEINFEKMARELGFKVPEEMFIALGCGDLSVNKVIKQISETEETADILEVTIPAQEKKSSTDAVEVVGLKGLLWTMARCCNPMPGDQIVGYITRGRGATIHRQDCPNILRRKDTERLLQVGWGKVEQTYAVTITVKAYDRQGLMGDISTLLQAENVNIADVSVNFNRTVADIKLVVEIRDLAQLSRILTRIENLPNVLEAQRTKPG